MPTYSQLQAESWWNQEIITDELKWLGGELRTSLGVGADAIGTKGNNVHLNGSHRSQDWITNSRYCTNRSYTVQSALTALQRRYIAALDVTPKSNADMLAISQRIDRATRAGELEEVIAWYGNTNNDQRVDGWDNIRNAVATSDSSHLWHLHIGFDRRVLTDMNVMRRVLAVLTGTGGDDMGFNDKQKADAAFNLKPTATLDTDGTDNGAGALREFDSPLYAAFAKLEQRIAALEQRPADGGAAAADVDAAAELAVQKLVKRLES